MYQVATVSQHVLSAYQVHEARKNQLMHYALTSRKEKSESQEKAFAEKFQKRFADMAKREHEDHLKHFQVCRIIKPDQSPISLRSMTETKCFAFSAMLIRSIHKTRSEEHTSELQSPCNLVCRLLLEKKKKT